ncbi:unnamed protein product [Dracunculus medinensis]|uniref:THAP-type domain-containing protein n=1 Tax=Dracunculus medinensis TaxID=318479 RepID=A0A0N4U4F8_DRAME|nr:unnamed protein product [Dracunculus medinensis]
MKNDLRGNHQWTLAILHAEGFLDEKYYDICAIMDSENSKQKVPFTFRRYLSIIWVDFILANITYGQYSDVDSMKFKWYKPKFGVGEHVCTMMDAKCSKQKLVSVGREDDSINSGCDYALAVVNKKTRKVNLLPTKMINFESCSSNWENLIGDKFPTKRDYSLNFSTDQESRAIKRRALQSEFGSSKLMRAINLSNRRQIKDETLKTMIDSAMVSSLNENSDSKGVQSLTIIERAQGTVLPKANLAAKLPCDVYSLDMFFTELEIDEVEADAVVFFTRSENEILESGFSPLAFKYFNEENKKKKRLCFVLFLDAMINCFKKIGKNFRRHITTEECSNLCYPVKFKEKLMQMFFAGDFRKESARSKSKLFLNATDKDRLLSHLLCLAISLNC